MSVGIHIVPSADLAALAAEDMWRAGLCTGISPTYWTVWNMKRRSEQIDATIRLLVAFGLRAARETGLTSRAAFQQMAWRETSPPRGKIVSLASPVAKGA